MTNGMECTFLVGQKVVLVRDFDPGVRIEAQKDGIILPLMDTIYTVRAVGAVGDMVVIWLVEIVNDKRYYLEFFQVLEQGFDPTRFRPVVSRPTDISVFKAMLTKAPAELEVLA